MAAAPLRLCFFQHLLDLSFGAAVGHAGPVGGVAEDRADLFVGEFAEDPEGEHLNYFCFTRFHARMLRRWSGTAARGSRSCCPV